uniref:SARAH domain-containing protein n=1 Tax=Steinernema glaseri TaxID=37863 RepID=A0A1I7ZLQ8_9BILA
MSSNLVDSYNPLYDANLRHYFTSPHMQRHLRSIGLGAISVGKSCLRRLVSGLCASFLIRRAGDNPNPALQLDSNGVPVASNGNVESEVYSRHYVMMDMLLRNRETQLMQLVDLQRKLDAAEKVQSYRRVRVGPIL